MPAPRWFCYRATVRWPLCIALVLMVSGAAAQADDPLAGLESSDPAARARAARTAGDQGLAAAAEALQRLLSDAEWEVRAAAARALGRLRHVAAKRDLMVLAQTDPSTAVRRAAAEAVKQLDPQGFVSTLGTADLPPVRARPEPAEQPTVRSSRAVLLSVGGASNALRFTDSVAGLAATGLRWPHADVQLTLSFPSLALAAQGRWNILPRSPVVPYLTAGGAVAYNNTRSEVDSAASLFVGGGVRVGPFWPRYYAYAEVLANWVLLQGRPAGEQVELKDFTLPVLVGVGAELWP